MRATVFPAPSDLASWADTRLVLPQGVTATKRSARHPGGLHRRGRSGLALLGQYVVAGIHIGKPCRIRAEKHHILVFIRKLTRKMSRRVAVARDYYLHMTIF